MSSQAKIKYIFIGTKKHSAHAFIHVVDFSDPVVQIEVVAVAAGSDSVGSDWVVVDADFVAVVFVGLTAVVVAVVGSADFAAVDLLDSADFVDGLT